MAKLKYFITQSWHTALSIVKIVLQSRPCDTPPQANTNDELVILGNGPSLNNTMQNHKDFLLSRHLLAVNFAANTPIFTELRPKFYMLTDPHFFVRMEQGNVKQLWENFAKKVDWDMTLFIPTKVKRCGEWFSLAKSNKNISICTYNMTPIEGLQWFENLAYNHRWGMPRPRNVLIPSLMQAIAMQYKKVYLAGADHSWLKTLSVDDDNRVVSIQPHFYKEAKSEEERIKKDYMNIPLHQVLESMYIAFRTYHVIRRYAEYRGVEILNITPDSFIDAFKKLKLKVKNP
ncbi:MAG: hypothetical protein E7080_04630 [Bacteroidales bacterium]|nr:hypothetical protein [Bacteroidales bacterium]